MSNSRGIGLNNEMKRLIRSVVEVIIEEGYDVSEITDEIYLTHKNVTKTHNNDEVEKVNFDETLTHEVEKKLWDMFTTFWPDLNTKYIRRMVIVCSTYIVARKQGKTLNMEDIAIISSKRLNLKVSTIRGQIASYCSKIANKFFERDTTYCHSVSSKWCLSELYVKYFAK